MSSNLMEQIGKDHREMEESYKSYKNATNEEEAKKYFYQFLWQICRHAVAEELVIYPMMEKKDEVGRSLVLDSRDDHKRLKQQLEHLIHENDKEKFEKKFDAIFEEFEEHVKFEENQDYFWVTQHFSEEEMAKAAKIFDKKKHFVSTRPHPAIPDRPAMLEEVLDFLVTPIDKLRDMFASFPDEVAKDTVAAS